MEEVLKEVGEENVVQIVTDNAANYVAAGKLLMERHRHLFGPLVLLIALTSCWRI